MAGHLLFFIQLHWLDILDILCVAFLMYQLYNLMKGTVAIRIFLGILAIYLLWKIVEALQMRLLSEILGQFIGVGVIALIIVFQQEIRRFLIIIGNTRFFKKNKRKKSIFSLIQLEDETTTDVDEVIKACKRMSNNKTGALIIIATNSNLKYYSITGQELNAKLSADLLESIFFKNSPLHDGGVIINHNKIVAARCVLPLTENQELPAFLGLRHRAAIGMTESSDAVAIVVSEETGDISFAKKGHIELHLDSETLKKKVLKTIQN